MVYGEMPNYMPNALKGFGFIESLIIELKILKEFEKVPPLNNFLEIYSFRN